jgi:hypothetical protein
MKSGCSSCKYWGRYYWGSWYIDDNGVERCGDGPPTQGTCQRWPPSNNAAWNALNRGFPVTGANDWCGEYEDKVEEVVQDEKA